MPLIPILIALTGAGFGAYFGAQVDDKLDPNNHPYNEKASTPNMTKIILYAGAGLALAYGARKVFKF